MIHLSTDASSLRTTATVVMGMCLAVAACESNTETTPATAGSGGTTATNTGGGGTGGSTSDGGMGIGGFVMNDDCGNDILDAGETCDDGNALPGDGCSGSCIIECGYLCLAFGAPCIAGFHGVQCASPGPPFGQPSAIANACQMATLSLDGTHIALSPETTEASAPIHLDAIFTDGQNALFGFAGDAENIAPGSHLVAIDAATGVVTPIGSDLGVWVMGAAMNDAGALWVTVFDTYERNETTQVRIAQVNPATGAFLTGPTTLTSNNQPVTVWSTHVSDVAFRADGAMFLSANEPGPLPPEPLSQYFEVDPLTATVVSTIDGPDDIYAAGIVFVGDSQQIVAMDIRGVDDVYVLDLSMPPALDANILYPDPIPTNSGTADLAGCAKLPADIPF